MGVTKLVASSWDAETVEPETVEQKLVLLLRVYVAAVWDRE
jgi:hypothetical protein